MSHVTQNAAYGRLLCVHTADGRKGLGEIVFAPSLLPESRQQRIVDEQDYLPGLIGQDVEALADLAKQFQGRGKAWCGVAFGLETACFELQAQRKHQSIADLLGGPLIDAVDDYFSISERDVERIRERLAVAGPDRAVIQLKLGIGSIETDAAHITAALDSMTESQTLMADANGGWSVREACEIIVGFDDPRVMWEEPCSAYEDNIVVARRSGQPVMVDQCVGNLETAIRAAKEHVAAAICIKPAFLGGLIAARQVRDLCAEAGVRMRSDGPWCGDIATAAILHVAVGAPPDLLIAGCDLREPLVIEPALNGVASQGHARIAPPPGPGLGIELSEDRLGDPEAIYQ